MVKRGIRLAISVVIGVMIVGGEVEGQTRPSRVDNDKARAAEVIKCSGAGANEDRTVVIEGCLYTVKCVNPKVITYVGNLHCERKLPPNPKVPPVPGPINERLDKK